MSDNINEIMSKFGFLDKYIAKEPHIFELLNEIYRIQKNSLPEGNDPLAAIDVLKGSRNIKIPFTTKREQNIDYLIELLLKNYPRHFQSIITFQFDVDTETKKLSVTEHLEYGVMLSETDYEKLVSMRDIKSRENLLELVGKFRFFNLSKLIKLVKHKNDLLRIIKLELGTHLFSFKNFNIDRNKIEWAEDHCFHARNYKSVRESIKLDKLTEIIRAHVDHINKRLKKFGILNADFSDYRDSKLDYLFNILLEDMPVSLSEREIVEIKNIQSLRKCIIKVDKVLDPLVTLGTDIVNYIKENNLSTPADIVASSVEITDEMLKKWSVPENLDSNKIVKNMLEDGATYYLFAPNLLPLIMELNQLLHYQPERMSELSHIERTQKELQMEVLYRIAKNILISEETIDELLSIEREQIDILHKIVADHENLQKTEILKKEYDKKSKYIVKKKRGFLKIIFDFFNFLFSSRKKEVKEKKGKVISTKKHITKETRQIYKQVVNLNQPVIPLSNIVEITPENSAIIDEAINEIRQNNIKIVIPIYHARKVLYPNRSQKILISDIEYLLVPPRVIQSFESIRDYTDSLVGEKIKDEAMPRSALMAIEKYLMSLYQQKRAQSLRKDLKGKVAGK